MIGIIIQARMGSSRLSGKILMKLEGEPLLGHILNRLKYLHTPVTTVIATTDLPQDDVVEAFCQERNALCFRGEESNVLKRYFDCTEFYQFDHVVRMTGDNPFPDIEELDRLIRFHEENSLDYSESFSVLPIGVGLEIMSYKLLRESLAKATLPKHFEHVNEYILDNLTQYRYGTLSVPKSKNKPDIRLTVDTLQDYERACFILRHADKAYVDTEQAIALSQLYDQQEHIK